MIRMLVVCIAAVAGVLPGPVGAGGNVARALCLEGETVVSGGTPEDLSLACAATGRALAQLSACGLERRGRLEMEIVTEISALGTEDCLGAFSRREGRIRVVAPGCLEAAVTPDNPFAAIAPEAHFASLVAHEVAHAVFDGIAGDRALADHEYVASAMQFAVLSESERDRVLSAAGDPGEVATRELTSFLAAAAPLRFGARAWRHFAAPSHGCAFVRDLAQGRTTLGRFRD